MLVGTQFCSAVKGMPHHIPTYAAAIFLRDEIIHFPAGKCGRNGETESVAQREREEEAHDRTEGHLHLFCMCLPRSAVGHVLCLS